MIDKNKFVKYINKLIQLNEIEDDINKSLQKLGKDFNGINFGEYTSLILEILKDAFSDKSEWIDYWVYELDYGKNYKKGTISIDNKDIKLKTPNDLYDLIFKESHTDKSKVNTKI